MRVCIEPLIDKGDVKSVVYCLLFLSHMVNTKIVTEENRAGPRVLQFTRSKQRK